MVSDRLTEARQAERRAVLSHAPLATREAIDALLTLDATLGDTVRTTREPLVGQMRLTWWHEALRGLDDRPPPAQPVLAALAGHVVGHGVAGADLARLVEGWEALLDPLDPDAIDRAGERGAVLFGAAAAVLDATDPVAAAGRGWALADLSRHLSDSALADHAKTGARAALREATGRRWSRRGRVLGALALLAADDVAERPSPPAGWRRVGRVLRLRLTGR